MGRGRYTSAIFNDRSHSAFADQSSKCGKKIRYAKRSHAEAAITKLSTGRTRISSHADAAQMIAYRCGYCGGFHTGHATTKYDS
jgi:hypothetical protein